MLEGDERDLFVLYAIPIRSFCISNVLYCIFEASSFIANTVFACHLVYLNIKHLDSPMFSILQTSP
jgi:hypothetical protein